MKSVYLWKEARNTLKYRVINTKDILKICRDHWYLTITIRKSINRLQQCRLHSRPKTKPDDTNNSRWN